MLVLFILGHLYFLCVLSIFAVLFCSYFLIHLSNTAPNKKNMYCIRKPHGFKALLPCPSFRLLFVSNAGTKKKTVQLFFLCALLLFVLYDVKKLLKFFFVKKQQVENYNSFSKESYRKILL